MKNSMKKFALAAVAAVAFGAVAVFATTVSECQTIIANLKTNTAAVTITGRQAEKDLAGLTVKLNEASAKLDQAKFCDSIQKLNDFKARVNQLVAGGKLDAAAGQALLAEADSAITCVNDLVTQSGTVCSF